MVEDVARPGRHGLDIAAEPGHQVVDEAGLREKAREVVRPPSRRMLDA